MDVSKGLGSIFRQVFLGKRGNVADAIFAVADAINNLAAAQQERGADSLKASVLGDDLDLVRSVELLNKSGSR